MRHPTNVNLVVEAAATTGPLTTPGIGGCIDQGVWEAQIEIVIRQCLEMTMQP